MEKLFIDHTEDTPQVILDIENKNFSITGRSLPENAVAFYIPIIDWLKQLNKEVIPSFVFNIKLDYFNTASAKQITKLLLTLQNLSQTMDIVINWHYLEEDTDIMSSGMRFSKLINANIKLIPYQE